MPALTYDEDVDFCVDLDEADIARSTDIDELRGWCDDAEATIDDIKHQIQGAALGGFAERAWVFRASKAMGYMARARYRLLARLQALGWTKPQLARDLAHVSQKLAEAKALNAVAVEFHRLCAEGGFSNREQFYKLEKQATASIALKDKKRADHEAAQVAIKEMAA